MTDPLLFHNAISRYNIKTFQSSCKSVGIKRNNNTKSINVNRNILGALVSYSIQSEKAVDIEKALEFPLSPVLLSIANADGSRRQASKSKLLEVLNASITNYNYVSRCRTGRTCAPEVIFFLPKRSGALILGKALRH